MMHSRDVFLMQECAMKRRQLFELEDQPWFPRVIRNLMTDYLRHAVELFNMHQATVPLLDTLIEQTGTTRVIDLASGGGGPWRKLAPALREKHPDLRVTLSDLYPSTQTLQQVASSCPEVIEVRESPTDACAVPDDLKGIRTQFLSLHHFDESGVRAIFENAIRAKQPIAVFEFQQRSISNAIQFALSPIFVLILTLTMRPITLTRLLFTYIIPIVPLAIGWDGVVSVLRTYTPNEIEAIVRTIEASDSYEWSFGLDRTTKVPCVYAIGYPQI
jgi:hypothetical protein